VPRFARSCGERSSPGAGNQTWKASTDPEFTAKMARILDLYDTRPLMGR
jgi:hypothetical protein